MADAITPPRAGENAASGARPNVGPPYYGGPRLDPFDREATRLEYQQLRERIGRGRAWLADPANAVDRPRYIESQTLLARLLGRLGYLHENLVFQGAWTEYPIEAPEIVPWEVEPTVPSPEKKE